MDALLNARGVYLIFRGPSGGVQKRDWEAFILITVTSSTKLICFQKKYQESLKLSECQLHQLIRQGRPEIHIALLIPTSMSESFLRVIVLPSLVYPYFELVIGQDEIQKILFFKQETECID